MSGQGKNGESFKVRLAVADDCDDIVHLIKELAEYGKMQDQVHMTAEQLRLDGFGKNIYFRCLVAESVHSEPSNRSPLVGYALFFDRYSSWEGRCIFLEDLYVSPACRQRGIGWTLFKGVVKIAHDEGYHRVEFNVLAWNAPALAFYKKSNAINLTETEQLHSFRLDAAAIKCLV